MADCIIDVVGPDDLAIIVELFNQIYRPARDIDTFRRRFQARHNILTMVARLENHAVGFFLGFELKPTVFFTWFYGVLPEFRRQGIASQLMEAAHAWAKMQGYEYIRFECHNQHRPMLHLAIELGYDIVGIRWDPDRADNLVIFDKYLQGGGS
jgi:GNAT superfamily N-acetyltransferase